jgi:hypothetical protein
MAGVQQGPRARAAAIDSLLLRVAAASCAPRARPAKVRAVAAPTSGETISMAWGGTRGKQGLHKQSLWVAKCAALKTACAWSLAQALKRRAHFGAQYPESVTGQLSGSRDDTRNRHRRASSVGLIIATYDIWKPMESILLSQVRWLGTPFSADCLDLQCVGSETAALDQPDDANLASSDFPHSDEPRDLLGMIPGQFPSVADSQPVAPVHYHVSQPAR